MMTKKSTHSQKAYLSKRVLVRAIQKACAKLSSDAMKIKGYVVRVEGNWIVKIYPSGTREKLSRISQVNPCKKVILD